MTKASQHFSLSKGCGYGAPFEKGSFFPINFVSWTTTPEEKLKVDSENYWPEAR
jgi:hypothetical protein